MKKSDTVCNARRDITSEPCGKGVYVGEVFDLGRVPGLIARFGIAHIDSMTHRTDKNPEHLRRLEKTGPGHAGHPLTRQYQVQTKDYQALVARLRKKIWLAHINATRKSGSRQDSILRLYPQFAHRGCHAAAEIATVLGLSRGHVASVLIERGCRPKRCAHKKKIKTQVQESHIRPLK